MAAILAFDDALGGGQALGVDAGVADHRQQQVEHLALVTGRGLDDKGGVGTAGVGVPFTAQGLHARFQTAFAAAVEATEQHVLEQVRQLLLLTGKIIEANPDHQPYRHMIALITRLEQHLQTIGQQVAFDLRAVEGKAGHGPQQQAQEHQATHGKLPCGGCAVAVKVNGHRPGHCRAVNRRYRNHPILHRHCCRTRSSVVSYRQSVPGARRWFRYFAPLYVAGG
ncbi:hypothetical protein D3C76_999690 [compost metagenome]